MADIIPMSIEMKVKRGNMIDQTYGGTHNGIDFSGKSIYAEMRIAMDSPVVLKYSTSDGTLTFSYDSSTFTLRFYQKASAILAIPCNIYQLEVMMGTSPDYDDHQTFIIGICEIGTQIVQNPIP